ncbi:hypothetical protein SEVIR_1G030300v4 [Setaria viridis]|uniref:Polyphenol oxidase C-terminal domain-containing protein n=1 Tax=Setaria viridis TaxID=4556 RepID=A0A4U6W6C7_SETVI|nr:hypothetical protein SEVIR_1G030300v2 [Setaria viridis]
MPSADGPGIFVLLLATVFMGAAAGHGGKDGCIQRVDEVSSAPGSCLCYDRCSHGGGLTTAESLTCFVNCVLRSGCVCPGDDDREALGLPALLDGTVRVSVTRPRVSRSRIEKNEEDEVLVVEVTFEDDTPPPFSIHVNAPVGGERDEFAAGAFVGYGPAPTMEEKRTGRTVVRNPIGDVLEMIGAEGDKTIDVSFWPVDVDGTWYKKHRIFITAVRIEYERKNKYLLQGT